MNQKGQSLIFLLVGILVIAAIGGAFYLGRSTLLRQDSAGQATPKPSPSPVATSSSPVSDASPVPNGTGETANPDSIGANWKTYTSEDKTFSFKYPPEWIYETNKTELQLQGKQYNSVYVGAGRPFTEEQRKAQGYINLNDAPKTYNDFALVYATSPDFENLSLNDLVEELIGKRAQIDEQKSILLNGNISAKEVGYGCQAYCMDIIFKNKNTIFDFTTGPNADANITTLRQILSTFKFIP